MPIAAMGVPRQKHRSISASSRSQSTMQPSSEAEQACSTLDGLCATAVTSSVWPSSWRTCAPVAHEKTLMTMPEQQSRYLLSVLKLHPWSTSEPPESSAPASAIVRSAIGASTGTVYAGWKGGKLGDAARHNFLYMCL